MGEYAEYGFDQQSLIWYVCRLWDMVFSLCFEHLPFVGADRLKKLREGDSIGPLTSTFDTIHPIDQTFGPYNKRSLYFQIIETTCCLIGFHGNHGNIITSLAAAILNFQIFKFFFHI